jgi:hypothetical protein
MLTGAVAQGTAIQFAGSGQTTTLDCAGGGVQILGSNNKLTVTGGCAMLSMVGSNNAVTATLAKNANIQFVGSNNEIIWSTPDGKQPLTQYLGSGNILTAAH